ncbi:hypothetical protein B0H67DRAFT_650051 [Lasiosphaeris hirsuta]|uniref:Uncharacterized protein n=1 Tax=Lasiosphaeris hirsuta TaxID=260670 RepID=A0AA40DGW0_9PEZI|nr:hypothetical protein B0H67DRAFT_650051 [Lasiosphaeris hirsuta]
MQHLPPLPFPPALSAAAGKLPEQSSTPLATLVGHLKQSVRESKKVAAKVKREWGRVYARFEAGNNPSQVPGEIFGDWARREIGDDTLCAVLNLEFQAVYRENVDKEPQRVARIRQLVNHLDFPNPILLTLYFGSIVITSHSFVTKATRLPVPLNPATYLTLCEARAARLGLANVLHKSDAVLSTAAFAHSGDRRFSLAKGKKQTFMPRDLLGLVAARPPDEAEIHDDTSDEEHDEDRDVDDDVDNGNDSSDNASLSISSSRQDSYA